MLYISATLCLYKTSKRRNQLMKNLKNLFIATLGFALVLSTTTIPNDYDINPCGHYDNLVEEF